MRTIILFLALAAGSILTVGAKTSEEKSTSTTEGRLTVNGSASVSITPDRMTIEIGMTEFYRKTSATDSVKVGLGEIETSVRDVLTRNGVADSLITLSDIGNYYYYGVAPDDFFMTKRLQATLTEMWQLDSIAGGMDVQGVSSFRIAGTDASDMERYNRQGLQAALAKAREKAELIAASEGVTLIGPVDIREDGPIYYEEATVANVALDGGSGMVAKMARAASTMDAMKKIVRRYNVCVVYAYKL